MVLFAGSGLGFSGVLFFGPGTTVGTSGVSCPDSLFGRDVPPVCFYASPSPDQTRTPSPQLPIHLMQRQYSTLVRARAPSRLEIHGMHPSHRKSCAHSCSFNNASLKLWRRCMLVCDARLGYCQDRHTHTHIHIHIHICIYICMCIHIYIYIYASLSVQFSEACCARHMVDHRHVGCIARAGRLWKQIARVALNGIGLQANGHS